MMPAFRLRDWIAVYESWMDTGEPTVRSQYEQLMGNLYGADKDHLHVKKLRTQLIGEVGLEMSDLWSMELIIQDLPGGMLEWATMTLQDQGRRIAAISLRNKIRTLERANDIIRHNREMLIERRRREDARKNQSSKTGTP